MVRILGAWLVFVSSLLVGLWGCSQNNSDLPHEQALAEYGYRPVVPTTGNGRGEDQHSALPSSSAPSYDTEQGRQSLKGISVAVPDGWEIVPPSGMRLAEYTLPGTVENGADASLTVFYFGPNQGGSVEANIERWYGQFSQPDKGSTKARSRRWEAKVGNMAVTHVDIGGTFSGGMAPMGGGGPQEEYRMLGSIVMAPAGPYFFKLVGPAATVQAWSESYDGFIASIQPE